MTESFTTGAGGLPGNDDLGATSAWYVWSAMGMYPVTPGADTLAIHGPTFPSVLIQRAGGNIQINGGSSQQRLRAKPHPQRLRRVEQLPALPRPRRRRHPAVHDGRAPSRAGAPAPATSRRPSPTAPPSRRPRPTLGTNLALGKTATGSTACATTETAAKAVDGSLANNSKFCSSTAPRFLQVDLGSSQTVSSFVLKHAGLGGESTGWNTGAFTISTSTDGTTWTHGGDRHRQPLQPHPAPDHAARTARYVKVDIGTPANDGNAAARIYELEVYGGGAPAGNLALGRPATADSSCATTEGPDKAVNGSVSGGNTDKWCSLGTNKFLQVDLGSTVHIGSLVVRHAGAGGEDAAWNTRDYDLQTSTDGSTWTTAAQVRANTADSTTTTTNVNARYIRLNIITPTQNTNTAARIYEFEAYN